MKPRTITPTDIFIDYSYCMYDALFSAVRIYKNEFNPICSTDNPPDFTLDDDFCHILKSRFNVKLYNGIRKKYPFAKTKNFVFLKDCSKKYIWRRDYDPTYKQNRIDSAAASPLDYNLGAIFNYFNNYIIQDILDDGAVLIFHENCEADDLFFILSKLKNTRLGLDKSHSAAYVNDGDWCHRQDYVCKIFNSTGDEKKIPYDLTLKEWQLMKILIGDPKDGVYKAIHENFTGRMGPKTAIKYVKDKALLKEAIKNNIFDKDKMANNKQMLMPDAIPEIIVEEVWKQYLEKREIDDSNLIGSL